MKRFFFVFLCVISIVSLMVVSAFATEVIRAHYSNDHFESFTNTNNPIPTGEYFISFYIPALDRTYELGSYELTLQPFYISSAPDDPFSDAVLFSFDSYNFDSEAPNEFVFDFLWDWTGSEYILVDDMSYSFAVAFIDDNEYANVVVELTPVSFDGDKVPFMTALSDSVNLFISWLEELAVLIVSSPVLVGLSVGLVVVLFVLYLVKRF